MINRSRSVVRLSPLWRQFSSHPGVLAQYRDLCARGKCISDEHQEAAIVKLDLLSKAISANQYQNAKGYYLHSGVGRGKTMLMDIFCANIQVPKLRVHYHEFMLQVHRKLYQNKGSADPLKHVAEEIASKTHVMCIDELEITDVADAFVTRSLFERLWALGMITVFTTNCVPSALYKDGINRDLFVPFISSLERNCEIISLDPPDKAGTDYRASSEPLLGTTWCTNPEQFRAMWDVILHATHIDGGDNNVLMNRPLVISATRHLVVPVSVNCACQFTFHELCSASVGNSDYLALTEAPKVTTDPPGVNTGKEIPGGFSVIFLKDVPILSTSNSNDARRFINLIDLLYERHVLLVLGCEDDERVVEKLSEESGVYGPGVIFSHWLAEIGDHTVRKSGKVAGAPDNDSDANKTKRALSGGSTFTHKAIARAVSRLNEMCGREYVKAWEKKNEKFVHPINLHEINHVGVVDNDQ